MNQQIDRLEGSLNEVNPENPVPAEVKVIHLDYPVRSIPRYGYGKAAHPALYEMINRLRSRYRNHLEHFLLLKDYFLKIPVTEPERAEDPCWSNGWLPGLDSITIYSFLWLNKPRRYFEVGSGNSTKFARRAILDHHLPTQITSIDPQPRAEIDQICDRVIRQPLEDADLRIFDELEAGDVLFIDNSHRCFMNSDVTVVFLDVLPRLNPGILVEFHDILLPYDYPSHYINLYYSEQYLLAAYLLAQGPKIEVTLPNAFISLDPELSLILGPLWKEPAMEGAERHGCSFWIQTK